MVKFLLEQKAEINAKDKNSWTALMFAAKDGYPAIVEMLIQRGADFRITDKHGLSVVAGSIRDGHTDIARQLIVKSIETWGHEIRNFLN